MIKSISSHNFIPSTENVDKIDNDVLKYNKDADFKSLNFKTLSNDVEIHSKINESSKILIFSANRQIHQSSSVKEQVKIEGSSNMNDLKIPKENFIKELELCILEAKKDLKNPLNVDKVFDCIERLSQRDTQNEPVTLSLQCYEAALSACVLCKYEHDARNRPDCFVWIYDIGKKLYQLNFRCY